MQEGYRLQTYSLIETLANAVEFQIVHAAALAEGEPGAEFVNRIPFNRLFLIEEQSRVPSDSFAATEADLEPVELATGRAVFLPADALCRMRFGAGLRLLAIHFTLGPPGRPDVFHRSRHCAIHLMPVAEIVKIRQTTERSEHSLARALQARQAFLGLVLDFAGDEALDAVAHPEAFPLLNRLQEILQAQPPAHWRVGQLAADLGLSPDALAKRFQRETGAVLKDYLTRELIRRSTSLLLTSDASIRNIAAELGFSSDQYFSRFIRAHTRMTPGELRKWRPASERTKF